MTQLDGSAGRSRRPGGVIFAKLFPNQAEPFRGIFVAEQLRATAADVEWSVVAPVPWIPHWAAQVFGKPYVRGHSRYDGVPVFRPRYPVLPKRLLYATVAPLIALTARRAFAQAVAETGARFVHVHDLYPSGAAARRLCRDAGLPYILTVHGLDLYSNLVNPRWRAEITAAAHGARSIVCVGSRLARDCVAELGVPEGLVRVIPDTYDDVRFRLVDRRPDPAGVRLLSVGRLSSEKGHAVLIEAFARLMRAGLTMTLDLVGDGPERSALESLAARLGVAARVRFTGTLLDEELGQAMAAADLFVLPSLQEGFGVVVVEALATGLPVVATRSGGPEDIVTPADGVLVEPGDAVALAEAIRITAQRLDRYDAPGIARRATERFSPGVVGARLVELYRELLTSSDGAMR